MIKPKIIPPGVYVFVGGQGAGKTSLAQGVVRIIYKYYQKGINKEAQAQVDALNASKDYKLTLAKHNIYTNFLSYLDKKHKVTTHYIDTTCFGLPNKEYKVVHFPYGSTIVIDEADIILSCKDNRFRRYIIALIKYARHNNLRLIFIVQSFSALQKRVRELVQFVFFINKQIVKKFFCCIYKIKWLISVLDNFQRQFLEIKKECGCTISEKEMNSCFTSFKFKYRGNVFKTYDSEIGKAYFLSGLKRYEYVQHPIFNYDRKSIEEFCLAHPLADLD